ncbi:thioesterase family protein [Neobacillus drentensis]|uniref:acyl-CoA thioesterase n=1 Tax=Neobacillus drentensis TaxID=220684 RepID=UPI0030011C3E
MTYTELELIAESKQGHVNNVKLYEYLDQARKEWYHFCILIGVEAVAVHIGVDYKKEVFQGDKLFITTTLERVGNTSFTLTQKIIRDEQELVVSSEAVLTTIDRKLRSKVKVPDEVRSLLNIESLLDTKPFISTI